MASLEENFNSAYQDWRRHIRDNASHHSFSKPYLDCDAFRKIVSLGRSAFPFIRDVYAKEKGEIGDPGIHWAYAVNKIEPEFKLPVGEQKGSVGATVCGFVALDIPRIKEATLQWLDDTVATFPP
jgi:hypothetical protein